MSFFSMREELVAEGQIAYDGFMNLKAFHRFFPDGLSLFRLVVSPLFLFLPFGGIPFFLLYGLCGLSDIADGFLARKWQTATRFGSTLDSLADLAFFVFIGVAIWPLLPWQAGFSVWTGVIFLLRLLSLTIGWLRFHAFGWSHTLANKVVGMALFLVPLGLFFGFNDVLLYLILSLASFSSVEELLIVALEKTYNSNIRSVFALLKERSKSR